MTLHTRDVLVGDRLKFWEANVSRGLCERCGAGSTFHERGEEESQTSSGSGDFMPRYVRGKLPWTRGVWEDTPVATTAHKACYDCVAPGKHWVP